MGYSRIQQLEFLNSINDTTPTSDWVARVNDFNECRIEDERVTCESCRRWVGSCPQLLGCVKTLKRRCIRWVAIP